MFANLVALANSPAVMSLLNQGVILMGVRYFSVSLHTHRASVFYGNQPAKLSLGREIQPEEDAFMLIASQYAHTDFKRLEWSITTNYDND